MSPRAVASDLTVKDDLLDESLLDATPPPQLEVSPRAKDDASLDLGLEPDPAPAPRVIQGTKLPPGSAPPPALDAGLLREVPPEVQALGSDALTPLVEETPMVLGSDALQELPPAPQGAWDDATPADVPIVLGAEALSEVAPAALPMDALVPAQGDQGFSYNACPKCSTPKGASALCDNCGTRLVFKAKKKDKEVSGKKRCRDCGTANKATRSRCLNCGCRLPSDD